MNDLPFESVKPRIVHFTETEHAYTVLVDDGRWFSAYWKSVPDPVDPTKRVTTFIWDELPQPPEIIR